MQELLQDGLSSDKFLITSKRDDEAGLGIYTAVIRILGYKK